MKKIAVLFFMFLFIGGAISFAKYADLSGTWYANDKASLEQEILGYMNEAQLPAINGEVIGFIAPHAGYRFSGPVAAYTYKAVMEKKPDKVILIAFSHKKYYPGKVSILTDDEFSTPLGKVAIDKALSEKVMASGGNIARIPEVFFSENSVELQIPFIQVAAPGAKLVALCLCDQRKDNCDALADALYKSLKDEKNYVVIASSDMCHYLPYNDAVARDSRTIEYLKGLDPNKFYLAGIREDRPDNLMCGYGAAYTLMCLSRKLGADKVEILKYANSGDTYGSKDKVVGYMSAVFYIQGESGTSLQPRAGQESGTREGGEMFSAAQKQELLKIARDTIELYLKTGEKLKPVVEDHLLNEDMGAFVTLHKKGQLRGCIGHMIASGPLYLTVRDMAIAASTQDPRFSTVEPEEMKDIDIEISVLTPMKKINDYRDIKIPGNGVMVRKGFRSGVYLPQVAEETGWNREEFMNSLCASKAGIPADSWKTGACDMYVFTAEVFGEKGAK